MHPEKCHAKNLVYWVKTSHISVVANVANETKTMNDDP